MASLRDVQNKIGGVKKTKQITNAMNMVASVKLRGAQTRIERFRPYADKFFEVLMDLTSKSGDVSHPLLEKRAEKKNVGIVLMTSDRGLCGGFNVGIINAAVRLAKSYVEEGVTPKFYCIGRKGRDAIKRLGYDIVSEEIGQLNSFDFQLAVSISNTVLYDFASGAVDEVHIVHGKFVSLGRQEPVLVPVLPVAGDELQASTEEETGGSTMEYAYEPSVSAILADILPRFVKVQVYRGLLDTSASEHAARMTAMDNATRNCDDIISALTLLFNKTRQAAITTDLIDIVAGAEALNG